MQRVQVRVGRVALSNSYDRGHCCLDDFRYARGVTGKRAGSWARWLTLQRFCKGRGAVADPCHGCDFTGSAAAVPAEMILAVAHDDYEMSGSDREGSATITTLESINGSKWFPQ